MWLCEYGQDSEQLHGAGRIRETGEIEKEYGGGGKD